MDLNFLKPLNLPFFRPKLKYKVPDIACTYKGFNKTLCEAFAKGCGGKVMPCEEATDHIATYGILRGTYITMKRALEFWYMDHGYFGEKNKYWRITRNAFIHSGEGDHSWDRFNKFGYELKDWRKNGEHIVIVPPSKYIAAAYDNMTWLDDLIAYLRTITDRQIVVSRKPDPPLANPQLFSKYEKDIPSLPLQEALKNAWVLITDQSNSMLHALMEGVPIICTNPNRKIGDISDIQNPPMEREILKNLAYNQWTIKEIESGQAWRELNQWG